MALEFSTDYIKDSLAVFRYYKQLAERAMDQVQHEDLLKAPDSESNSIATIVKHMAGNMKSRWTDFLSTDGEKPDRNRDAEFEDPPVTREQIMTLWEAGWNCVLQALEPLSEDDLNRVIIIRGERHSVMQAINRQIAHYSYHCGQIVFLAKHFRAGSWTSLSVPRGKSVEFNQKVLNREASQR